MLIWSEISPNISNLPYFGFAAPRRAQRDLSVAVMPALATLMDCCSMASWSAERSPFSILSISSTAATPISARTSAPASSVQRPSPNSSLTESPGGIGSRRASRVESRTAYTGAPAASKTAFTAAVKLGKSTDDAVALMLAALTAGLNRDEIKRLLAPGASDTTTFTASHTVSLAEMNAGHFDNTATAHGTPRNSGWARNRS